MEDEANDQIEDRNLTGLRPLSPPRELKGRLPITPEARASVVAGRAGIRDLVHGRDMQRLLVIVGPCSIHDPDAALDYAQRLQETADPLRDQLHVVMRTYFEKPRTTVGWKGLSNDPHLDGTCDVEEGIAQARGLLLRINELGLPCASELLDPFTPQYIADLLSWASIGARTTESQTHRELASGLSMPVGFKNGTDGGLAVAHHAMIAARHAHSFLGITADGASAVVSTSGNPDRHVVLRGGSAGPNHDAESIAEAFEQVREESLARPVMIDCSHGNSRKDYRLQGPVCREVLDLVRRRTPGILGMMIESNLEPGNQAWSPGQQLQRGVSITDACIGWDETAQLLNEMAEAVKLAH
ncbi:MAG: 3-deoxy-7-phosphoheptulonate synthase [Deltaproteobacteria bacterium]|nr:3-deoxy-7-phosphoheptulonate synthase [Deltaproteobacteria bacterium]MBW2361619.1 3-deoxy-7-phosphoheptulonate synthase [Deltaproteobacteria bacterium]